MMSKMLMQMTWMEEQISQTLSMRKIVTKTSMRIWISEVVTFTLISPNRWKPNSSRMQSFSQTSARRNGSLKSKELHTS